MPEPNERERIHPRKIVFDGTINAGHVLTFMSLLAALAVGWSQMDKRVVVLERDAEHQRTKDQTQDAAIKGGIDEVKFMLRDVQKSVDAVRDQQSRNRGGSQ